MTPNQYEALIRLFGEDSVNTTLARSKKRRDDDLNLLREIASSLPSGGGDEQ